VQSQQAWSTDEEKYTGEESYWPTLLTKYFYPDVKDLAAAQQAAIEAKKNPPAADPG